MIAVIAAFAPEDELPEVAAVAGTGTEGRPGWDRPILPRGVRRGTVGEFMAMWRSDTADVPQTGPALRVVPGGGS